MTSSLVGSEMCIRDSKKTSHPPVHQTPTHHSPTQGQWQWQCEEEGGPLPVSYTHLTLPTICSV
eukprot:6874183-Prorocentrum_lima.AAC.1